jgi:preprotein translocase subunit SecE
LVFTGAGAFANYYFSEVEWALRFGGCVILFCILLGLASLTTRGKQLYNFAKGAKIELLKVVWPKREETVKITMVIAGLVVMTSIVLWCIDSVLLCGMRWLTNSLI